MAVVVLDVLIDRFNSLCSAPSAWLLYLPTSDNIQKGDTLRVRLVDKFGVYLGQYREGVCQLTSTEQFIVYPKGTQCYYFNPLSMAVQIFTNALDKLNVAVSHTGGTTEVILHSMLIPANTLQANDIVRMLSFVDGTSSVGTKSFRWCFNTSNVVAGRTVAGFCQPTTGVAGSVAFIRNMVFKNALNAQGVVTSVAALNSDESMPSTTPDIAQTVNFGVDQYMMITGQLSAGTDTMTLISSYTTIIR